MLTSPKATRFQLQKGRMLRAAARCFNQKGFSGTSLKDVADMLDLTDAALYYYVKNKEELVYLCYVRAADLGREAMDLALAARSNGYLTIVTYLRNHIEMMVGERGPIAIMSEIPSLQRVHREEILTLSRAHSKRFEELLNVAIEDGSIVKNDVRMTGNAIMGSLNWIPKWFHGDQRAARLLVDEFPRILTRGLEKPQRAAELF
jgi:AcrR family transcriptional regulator